MAGETTTYDDVFGLESWQAAFYAIRDCDDLYDEQKSLEAEFEVSFDDMQSVIDLPDSSFRDFKEKVVLAATKYLEQSKDYLYQTVCVEFNYCAKRSHFTAKALEALILLLDIFKTGGAAYFTFFGFKSGFFDWLCGCDK